MVIFNGQQAGCEEQSTENRGYLYISTFSWNHYNLINALFI